MRMTWDHAYKGVARRQPVLQPVQQPVQQPASPLAASRRPLHPYPQTRESAPTIRRAARTRRMGPEHAAPRSSKATHPHPHPRRLHARRVARRHRHHRAADVDPAARARRGAASRPGGSSAPATSARSAWRWSCTATPSPTAASPAPSTTPTSTSSSTTPATSSPTPSASPATSARTTSPPALFLLIKNAGRAPEPVHLPLHRRRPRLPSTSTRSFRATGNPIPQNLSYSLATPYPSPAAADGRLRPGATPWARSSPWPPTSTPAPAAAPTRPTTSTGPAHDAPPRQMAAANSNNHANKGQNVLYGDGHVEFADTPYCGAARARLPRQHLHRRHRRRRRLRRHRPPRRRRWTPSCSPPTTRGEVGRMTR